MPKRKVTIRSPYNYDVDAVSVQSGLDCPEPTLTRQSDAADADINTIVKRFGLTGEIPQGARMPQYGDFDGISDYRTALHAIRDADAMFMALPASVRKEFGNDPAKYVEFCSDPANLPAMRKMGLAPKEKVDVIDGSPRSDVGAPVKAPEGGSSGDGKPAGGGEGKSGASGGGKSSA